LVGIPNVAARSGVIVRESGRPSIPERIDLSRMPAITGYPAFAGPDG
jgi:hypothetical protein